MKALTKNLILALPMTVIAAVLSAVTGQSAAAATFCVNPTGTGGCLSTIGAAVAKASPNDVINVASGSYPESVTISMPLTLQGANRENTIINATGKANGIYIDGIDATLLANVTVSGFTVQGANFEGILVTNSTAVAITDNIVTGNNLSENPANGGSCPGLPAFETNEAADCGEGIHLMGTDHSIVSNNSVFNNTGGILITDETRQASSNLIEGNTVSSNPYACGITMASHAPAPATGKQTSFGVYQNTVSKNVSTYNGLAVGGGAGVGIFTPNPGTVNYGNVVVGNTLTGNGLPGVALHSHAPNQVLSDNIIVGNRISGNGPDTGTPGPTGISILGVIAGTPTMLPIYGVMISGNEIDGEAADIVVQTSAQVTIQFNSLLGGATGIANIGTGVVQATQNWWGCSGGPGATGCSALTGTVGGAPWLANPIAK